MWSSTMWNPNPSMWNPYTWNPRATFRFEIDNFSKMESTTTILPSPTFLCGGCEWYLNAYVYPQGDICADSHLSLSLNVANPNLLQSGWKRSADFYFVLSNQLGKVLYKTPVAQARYSFNAMTPSWGVLETLPVSKLKENVGFWDMDKLIIEVYITNVEAVAGDVSEKEETVEINGFQVLVSQATLVSKLFAEHPDIAKDFKPKNEMVKTAYMNVLLNLIETLDKPSKNHSETEVGNAQSELCELIEVGFKLDWLKKKVDEVLLALKKTNDTDWSWVKQLEERLKNLEVMELRKVKAKLEEVSLERKKSDDAAGSLFQQLDKRVKNLELKETDFKVELLKIELDDLKTELNEVSSERTIENSRTEQLEERVKYLELYFIESLLKTKIADEVTLEKNKSDDDDDDDSDDDDDDDESSAEQLEKRVKNLELMESNLKLESLKTELDEVSLERKKENSRAQQLEERLKNLELMVACHKVELEKKDKSSADGFLLVDDVV